MSIVLPEGPGAPLLDFSAWGFLTTPIDDLLDRLDARIFELPTEEDGFMGGIIRRDWGLLVAVAQGMNPLEQDLAVRGLLATWYGVDIADWPTEMRFTELKTTA